MKNFFASFALIASISIPTTAKANTILVEVMSSAVAGYCLWQDGYFLSSEDAAQYVVDDLEDRGISAIQVKNIIANNGAMLRRYAKKCPSLMN